MLMQYRDNFGRWIGSEAWGHRSYQCFRSAGRILQRIEVVNNCTRLVVQLEMMLNLLLRLASSWRSLR